MQFLLAQIAESLTEWAWGGSRIDEATHLVQSYCYSKLPTRSATFARTIDAICFAPTIERIFLRLSPGTLVELTEDLLFLHKFETGGTFGRIAFNPVSRRLVTNDQFGPRGGLSNLMVQYLPISTIAFAIDTTTGDMFLASMVVSGTTNKNQLKVTHVNSQLDELARFFVAGHAVYGMFCYGGFLVVDHADDTGCVSVYDTTTGRKLHYFHTAQTIVHLDGHRRRIFLFGGGGPYAVDFDGNRLPEVSVKCCLDRLSTDLLVTAKFCDHQRALRLVEPL